MLKTLTKWMKKEPPRCAAVIVAAGRSSRMQGTDKILVPLNGEPLICHTLRTFQACALIDEIVVVTREDLVSQISRLCSQRGFNKVSMIVPGGETRAESVMRGMDHVAKGTKLAAIHDGARPFATEELIEQTIRSAQTYHAAAPAIAVKDTIKTAENHIVTQTPDRSKLYAVQTPQVFDFDLLRGALQKAYEEKLAITDDCSAVEALGMSVYLTKGADENIKVTTPLDLVIAEAILKNRSTT